MLLVGRQEGHPAYKKLERWGAGMVIRLERDADLHMAQLMPLPLTVPLRPDPLGELERSPDPLAAIGGGVPTSKGKRRKGNRKREEKKGWEVREERGRTTCIPHYFMSCVAG